MLVEALFFGLSLGSTIGFSDFSTNLLLLSPPGNPLNFAASATNNTLDDPFSRCGLDYNPKSNNYIATSQNRVQNYGMKVETDSVANKSRTPFRNGFFKYSCHPNPTPREEEEEAFCIFSNPDINQGSGMSVISKTSTFSESLEYILDLSQDPDNVEDPFYAVEMPEKGGAGVLAARRLVRGDLVVNSKAILLTSVEQSTLDRPDWHQIRKLAIDLLPVETRNKVASLYGVGNSEEEAISNAIDMNSFDIDFGLTENVPFFAMFLKPSQLNHDCRPNTAFYIDSQTLQVHLHALRTINPGDEMSISYRDMAQTRAERQIGLSDYGFQCTCDHCRMNDIQVKESDERIHRIQELSQKLNDWKQVRNKTTVKEAEELVELYRLEKLDDNIADGYTLAALTYNSFGYSSRARWYASKAIEAGIISYGPKWEELEALGEIVQDPGEHWSHKARILTLSE